MRGFCCIPKFSFNPVMPAVFDDSISYLEWVAKICSKVDDIIDVLNRLDGVTEDWVKQYVEAQLEDIRNLINDTNGQTLQQLNEFKAYVNNQINNILEMMDGIGDGILEEANRYTDEKFYDLMLEFSDMIEHGFLVYNPIKGYDTDVETAILDLYEAMRVPWSVTADEYDSLELTADEYDAVNMTAVQYDFFAKLFLYKWFAKTLISPLTGERATHQECIDELANLHRTGGITAGEYDALQLTAQTYDGKAIGAYDYDFNAKNLLTSGQSALNERAARKGLI